MKKTIFLLLALPIFSCTCHGQQESSSEELITQLAVDNLKIPNGFSLEVFHEGVGPARHVVVRDNGDVYIRLRNADPMGIVALRDGNQDGKAEITEYFDTIGGGTGIDIYKNYLY